MGTACAVALLAVGLAGCGNEGELVTARFVSAAPLVEGNQVKLKGIVVGTIESMRVRNGLAEVTMNLEPAAMPVHSDATFTIRPASLLGERYIDLDRGTAGSPALDTSRIVPVSQTATNVGLEDMLNTLDDPAGHGLAMLVDTLGGGVNGNGEKVDQTITGLAPNMKEVQALTAVLKNQNELIGRLVEDAEPIVGALADQEGDTVDRLVAASDSVLGVTASHQEDLEKTLDKLPDTLEVGRKTLRALSDTADEAAPTLDELEPFTEDLPEISEEMEEFADALDPALATSQPLLEAAEELLVQARRPADDLRIAGPELAQTVKGTEKLVDALTTNREDVFTFIRNWALNVNGFDGISHYWRIVVTVHPDSWTALLDMLGVRIPELLPTGPSGAAAAKPATSTARAESDGNEGKAALDVPEVVNGVTRPLTGLTEKLTGGSLLSGKKTQDGSSTGLSKKQESGLLGFLFGGGE
jgi:phospholipid/cholesterol/gamma-HCH transport system substrate-binding protein